MNNVIQPEGNYFLKYESKNPIIKKIMDGYFTALESALDGLEFETILDAGCGEGYVANYLYKITQKPVAAFDISDNVIKKASEEMPYIDFKAASIYDSGIPSESYDLVVCLEVLEHLDEPETAIREIQRITKQYIIVSVPNEPIWRISNFIRGKYLDAWGNTPGHINHWNEKGIVEICESVGKIKRIFKPFPWIMLLIEKNSL